MNQLIQILKNIGAVRLIIIATVLVSLGTGLHYMTSKFAQPNLALLYSNLDMSDAGKIVSKIEAMGIDAEIRGGGTEVYVPSSEVARLRMEMAEIGLPRGGSLGYEIFDKSESIGTSNFVQDINRLRALEGEIGRSIATLSQVSTARVHLVLPRRELFSRERQEPSASIVLSLNGPGKLSQQRVVAIQQMVASAVPSLTPERVSIVDDRGNLLARGDSNADILSATNLEEMRLGTENRLSRIIESLVEKYVGPGKVRAEVSAEMNFDRIVENSEAYNPDEQVLRSSQTISEEEQSQEPGANAVGAANEVPQGQAAAAAGGGSSATKRTEETLNYEISKTIKSHTREVGAVKRLSVAVMIDGNYVAAEGAAEPTYEPRPEQEIDQLKTLVKNAIGFNEERGDTVEVINMKFAQLPQEGVLSEAPGFLSLTQADVVRLVEAAIIGIISLLMLLLVVKPLVIRLLESFGKPIDSEIEALEDPQTGERLPAKKADASPEEEEEEPPGPGVTDQIDKMITMQQVEGQVRESTLKQISSVIEEKPGDAVAIVREWMSEREPV